MEKELFDWSGWDGEQECMIFYNPVLKVPIGDYPIGTKFQSCAILQNTVIFQGLEKKEYAGILEFYQDDEKGTNGIPCAKFKLHYKVGDKL